MSGRERERRARIGWWGAVALCGATATASATEHSGRVFGTWTAADAPHVLADDAVVPAGATLRIQAGATVLATAGASLEVRGHLVADGLPDAPVVLAAAGRQPAPGDWEGLRVAGTGFALLRSADVRDAAVAVEVEDGGRADVQDSWLHASLDHGAWLRPGSEGRFDGTVIAFNGRAGVRLEGAGRFDRCRFLGNETPVIMHADARPSFAHVAAWGHALADGILVEGSAPLAGHRTWAGGGLPFLVGEGDELVVAGTLELAPGTVVKLDDAAAISVRGHLEAPCSAAERCVLTSAGDDAVLGDTDRDGAPEGSLDGSWKGLVVSGTAHFEETDLRFAKEAVEVQAGGSASFERCRLSGASDAAVSLDAGSTGRLHRCALHDNAVAIRVADGAELDLAGPSSPGRESGANAISCNGLDLQVRGSTPLAAARNYWGGPLAEPRAEGPVDAADRLIQAPEGMGPDVRVAVRDGELTLRWTETTSCDRYSVLTAAQAEGPFRLALEGSTVESELLSGELGSGEPLTFYRIVVSGS